MDNRALSASFTCSYLSVFQPESGKTLTDLLTRAGAGSRNLRFLACTAPGRANICPGPGCPACQLNLPKFIFRINLLKIGINTLKAIWLAQDKPQIHTKRILMQITKLSEKAEIKNLSFILFSIQRCCALNPVQAVRSSHGYP